ncbi:MAG: hypothetical protein Kow0069_25960 [Promethearchaeota archaeon]
MTISRRTVALTLLTAFALTTLATPLVLAKTRADAIYDFVERTKVPGAGFTATYPAPGLSEEQLPTMEASHYGVELLVNYARRRLTNESSFENWILNQQLTSGGFWNEEGGTATVFATYHAMSALDALGHAGRAKDSVVTFLDSCVKDNEAWGNTPGAAWNLVATYQALATYEIYLGNLSHVSQYLRDSALALTLSAQNPDGGFGGRPGDPSTLEATLAAIQIVKVLNATEDFDGGNAALGYVESFRNADADFPAEVGGYHGEESTKSLVLTTYYATRVKEELNNATDPGHQTMNWLLSRQNRLDGGFVEPVEGDELGRSSLTTTYYAIRALQVYDLDLSSLKEAKWNLEFDWVPLVVLVVVGVAVVVVVVVVWRRRSI